MTRGIQRLIGLKSFLEKERKISTRKLTVVFPLFAQ